MSHVPIYLLTPTRNRPDFLKVSIDSAKGLARHPDRVHALLGVDDDDSTDYRGYPYVRRGPRWGYPKLHAYYNSLSALAKSLDGDGPPGWSIMWNDDEKMLTLGWDEKLVAYSTLPHVRFLRRDCTAPTDTAYPAWPRSLYDVMGRIAACSACDTWLSQMALTADRLLLAGPTSPLVHCYAPDIFLRHERLEEVAPHRIDKVPFVSAEDDPWAHPYVTTVEREALRVARARGFTAWRDPSWIPPFDAEDVRVRLCRAAADMLAEGL